MSPAHRRPWSDQPARPSSLDTNRIYQPDVRLDPPAAAATGPMRAVLCALSRMCGWLGAWGFAFANRVAALPGLRAERACFRLPRGAAQERKPLLPTDNGEAAHCSITATLGFPVRAGSWMFIRVRNPSRVVAGVALSEGGSGHKSCAVKRAVRELSRGRPRGAARNAAAYVGRCSAHLRNWGCRQVCIGCEFSGAGAGVPGRELPDRNVTSTHNVAGRRCRSDRRPIAAVPASDQV